MSSSADFPENQRNFIDALVIFMNQCYNLIEYIEGKQAKPRLTEEERIAKIQELTSLITEKEKELSKLESERNELSGMDTKNMSKSTQDAYSCEDDCRADCHTKDSTAHTKSGDSSNYRK